jgi:hypothetical protein
MMATVQLRNTTDGRAYDDRKKANGTRPTEAMRCFRRRLSDTVYRTTLTDLAAHAARHAGTGPGGHRDSDSDSSATGSQPHTGSSDKPLPEPATSQRRTPDPAMS